VLVLLRGLLLSSHNSIIYLSILAHALSYIIIESASSSSIFEYNTSRLKNIFSTVLSSNYN